MALYRLVLDRAFSRFNVVFGAVDTTYIEELDGKRVGNKYKPLTGGVLFEMTRGKPGDLFVLVGTPMVTPAGWAALSKTLRPHVEPLPVVVSKEKRLILNVLVRSPTAVDAGACTVKRIALKTSEIPDAPIFGVTREGYLETIVGDSVKRAVTKAKLKGWLFEPVKEV